MLVKYFMLEIESKLLYIQNIFFSNSDFQFPTLLMHKYFSTPVQLLGKDRVTCFSNNFIFIYFLLRWQDGHINQRVEHFKKLVLALY
jgi:hypothetical protein